MLTSQIHSSNSALFLFANHKPFISGDHGGGGADFQIFRQKYSDEPRKSSRIQHARRSKIKAIVTPMQKTTSVSVVVTVQKTGGGILPNIGDDISDLLGKSLILELVAAEVEPKTGLEKATIKTYVHKNLKSDEKDTIKYDCEIEIPEEFGELGAILVENEHHKEMYLKKIVLDGFITGTVNITCDSWIHSKFDNPKKRLFFTNKHPRNYPRDCVPNMNVYCTKKNVEGIIVAETKLLIPHLMKI